MKDSGDGAFLPCVHPSYILVALESHRDPALAALQRRAKRGRLCFAGRRARKVLSVLGVEGAFSLILLSAAGQLDERLIRKQQSTIFEMKRRLELASPSPIGVGHWYGSPEHKISRSLSTTGTTDSGLGTSASFGSPSYDQVRSEFGRFASSRGRLFYNFLISLL